MLSQIAEQLHERIAAGAQEDGEDGEQRARLTEYCSVGDQGLFPLDSAVLTNDVLVNVASP